MTEPTPQQAASLTQAISETPTTADKTDYKTNDKANYQAKIGTFILFFIGLGVLVASLLTVKFWLDNKTERPPRPQTKELPFVETATVTLSANRVHIRAGGFVSAKTTAKITPQVSGKILRLSPNLQVGERVKQGEVLAQLGTTDYQVALATAKANLVTAQSNYAQVQGESRQAARDVKNLRLKATQLNLKKPQLNAAKAAVDNAKAQVELAQTNLERTTVTAPFDAIVQSSDVAVGEVANNATVLADLVATETYTVKLTLDSAAMKLLAVGNAVTLTDKVYGKNYRATLSRFAAGFDTQNRTIAVYVDIDHPTDSDKPLFLDSYLTAVIDGKSIAGSVNIPNSAIVNNAYVWAKDRDDRIAKAPITVIYRDAEQSLVTFSAPVNTLITLPKDSFSEGQQVTTQSTVSKRPERPERQAHQGTPKAPDKAKGQNGKQPDGEKSGEPPRQPPSVSNANGNKMANKSQQIELNCVLCRDRSRPVPTQNTDILNISDITKLSVFRWSPKNTPLTEASNG